jgi:hypothetical protein
MDALVALIARQVLVRILSVLLVCIAMVGILVAIVIMVIIVIIQITIDNMLAQQEAHAQAHLENHRHAFQVPTAQLINPLARYARMGIIAMQLTQIYIRAHARLAIIAQQRLK